MHTQTKETQLALTPELALEILKNGNKRFLNNVKSNRNLLQQMKDTSEGQFPLAVVLSCIDSRVPVEIIFDQGIGDMFSTRLAGNVVNEDVLGSMEYSCKVAGSKIVLVLGHTKCGAVTAACNHVELGNVTALLNKIKPSVEAIIKPNEEATPDQVEEVIVLNVRNAIKQVRKESPILKEMEDNGDIIIAGGIYDISSGEVEFL